MFPLLVWDRMLDPIWGVAPLPAPRFGAEFIPLDPITPDVKPGAEPPKLGDERLSAEEWEEGSPSPEPVIGGPPAVFPAPAAPCKQHVR